ncbi:Flp family type IVb pilin [Bisgaard Taxon 10/6]|uniref:Flp family type IVb pilin n=1 Tax=Exercitatus varius TaxID=67857 RepID=UPI00294B6B08|nr:Flp family type IVb pilin [Exercitatus varius]MDG2918526.1 Flp family type IVb pilin [Exercitatus varius]
MLTNFATKTRASLRNFRKNNKGVTAIEYGLIAVVMAIFIVGAFSTEGGFVQAISKKFTDLTSTITTGKAPTAAAPATSVPGTQEAGK